MNFTCIDFETANRYRDSACAIGVVRVENGAITDRIYRLIRPVNLYFDYRNIEIHGITATDVENEPLFDEIYSEIQHLFEDELLLAHNAAFDMSVLKYSLMAADVAPPRAHYFDSLQIARKLFPNLPNHKLNTLAGYFGYSFQHHHALEDAEVTAKIILDIFREFQVSKLNNFFKEHSISVKKL